MYKKVIILFISFSLLLNTINITLANTSKTTSNDIKNMTEYILSNYVGSDVTEEELYNGALKGMFNTLDKYSEFYNEDEFNSFTESMSGSFYGIGVHVKEENNLIKIVDVIDNSPAKKANLQSNDVIIKVNDKSVSNLSLDEVVNMIKGEKGTSINITIQRDGKTLEHKVTRDYVKVPSVYTKSFKELNITSNSKMLDQIQYVAITNINASTSNDFSEVIKKAKEENKDYLILDLRNNPGGYLLETLKICEMIIPQGPILYTVRKDGTEEVYNSKLKQKIFKNIIVLTNESTASAAEILSSSIKESKAGIVIGEKTFGKGVVQEVKALDNKGFKLTVEEYFSRNKNKINGIGVSPDIEVVVPNYLTDGTIRYSIGMKDDYVLSIEKILYYLKYLKFTPDNNYDKATQQAIKNFQKDAGLYSYGVCDFTTQIQLNKALSTSINQNDKQLEAALKYIQQNN